MFISKVLPRGLAARSGLRVGDRILAVNGQDVREATHQEAVSALLQPCLELVLLVRRDPPPPGMRELCIQKAPGERLGISIRGGTKGHAGNPCDPTDEGIFISKVSPTGAAGRDGRLRVGLRLLEVNQQSLLGLTHGEAVQLLRSVGDTLTVLVCDGFDTSVATPEVSAPRLALSHRDWVPRPAWPGGSWCAGPRTLLAVVSQTWGNRAVQCQAHISAPLVALVGQSVCTEGLVVS